MGVRQENSRSLAQGDALSESTASDDGQGTAQRRVLRYREVSLFV